VAVRRDRKNSENRPAPVFLHFRLSDQVHFQDSKGEMVSTRKRHARLGLETTVAMSHRGARRLGAGMCAPGGRQ
jgi:hypothetical protein